MKYKKLFKELLRYALVGGIAVGIDAGVYYLLNLFTAIDVSWIKRTSFVVGGIWSFFANKYFTFRQKELRVFEPVIFFIVILIGFFINSVTHDLVYWLTNSKIISFLIATGVSTITNFVGHKLITFNVKLIKKRKNAKENDE